VSLKNCLPSFLGNSFLNNETLTWNISQLVKLEFCHANDNVRKIYLKQQQQQNFNKQNSKLKPQQILKNTVAHNCHGKIFFVTAKSFWPRHNHFCYGKIILATAKSFSSRQNHFGQGKIIFVMAKSF